MKQEYMVIFSLRMAGFLMEHGFMLQDMKSHIDGSGKKVFYFFKSDEIEKVMEQYNNRKRKGVM